MRTEQLAYLIEISRHKSLSAASHILNMTPQALSMSIKALEDETDLKLLERSTTGVTLTASGQGLVRLAKHFFAGLEKLQTPKTLAAQTLKGELHLYMPAGATENYLPALMSATYREHPQLNIIPHPMDYPDIIQALEKGQIPFGLYYRMFLDQEDIIKDIPDALSFTPFFRTNFFCCCNPQLPIARYKTISLKTMASQTIISYAPAKYLFDPVFAHIGQSPKTIYVPNTLTVNELLDSQAGVSFSQFLASSRKATVQYHDVVHIPFQEKLSGDFGYLVSKKYPLKSAVSTHLSYLQAYFQQLYVQP